MSISRIQGIRTLLKGLETGDPNATKVIHPETYIQHNPQTQTGREGLAALFARLAKTEPRVNLVRAFSDGDYVFGHTEYDFSTRRIGFEVFRFEGAFAVEHWDNIQPRLGPNTAGHSMVDGPTQAVDLSATEANRALVRAFAETVLIGGEHAAVCTYVSSERYTEHDPHGSDGAAALQACLVDNPQALQHLRLHRVLAQGNFVLAVLEGTRGGTPTAFYELYRLHEGQIVEHWNTAEAVAPPEQWQHKNGKF